MTDPTPNLPAPQFIQEGGDAMTVRAKDFATYWLRERWVPVYEARGFDGAYRALGMSRSDFKEEVGASNVWVSKDGRFRVRVAGYQETPWGSSGRIAELRVYDWEDAA